MVTGGPKQSMPRDWDARTYDRVADPMTRWGTAVLDRLPLAGDERVLDAGCGTGRVTEQLAERLPRGRVVALDGSPSMIEAAQQRLARFGDAIEFVVADLGVPLPIDGHVDAILSTATFHWVPDHDALFANLAGVIRTGGWLVAQCGGAGNIASIKRALAATGDGWLGPAHYETVLATTRRLDAAGFVDIECWLTYEPTRFEPGEPFETYLRTVVLGAHLERLPAAEHDGFVRAVAERVGEPLIDYVRLNIVARRARRLTDAGAGDGLLVDRDVRDLDDGTAVVPRRAERAGDRHESPPHLLEVGFGGRGERGQDVIRHGAGQRHSAAALGRIGLHEQRAELRGSRVGQEVAGDPDDLAVVGRRPGEEGVDVDGCAGIDGPGAEADGATGAWLATGEPAAPVQALRIRARRPTNPVVTSR